jgi:hypothetical protein
VFSGSIRILMPLIRKPLPDTRSLPKAARRFCDFLPAFSRPHHFPSILIFIHHLRQRSPIQPPADRPQNRRNGASRHLRRGRRNGARRGSARARTIPTAPGCRSGAPPGRSASARSRADLGNAVGTAVVRGTAYLASLGAPAGWRSGVTRSPCASSASG